MYIKFDVVEKEMLREDNPAGQNNDWRLARVVEWNGLENRHTGNGIWGSNP